jgi:hypothetical protein
MKGYPWSNPSRRLWNRRLIALDKVAATRIGRSGGTMADLTRASGASTTEPFSRWRLVLWGQHRTANPPKGVSNIGGDRSEVRDGDGSPSSFGGGASSQRWCSSVASTVVARLLLGRHVIELAWVVVKSHVWGLLEFGGFFGLRAKIWTKVGRYL